MPTIDRLNHEAACPDALLKCPASTIGCNFVERRNAISDHSETCTLASIWTLWQVSERRAQTQEESLRALRREHHSIKRCLTQSQNSAPYEVLSGSHFDAESTGSHESRAHQSSSVFFEDRQCDSATHHLLSMHELLRGELNGLSNSLRDLEGRLSMTMINENLRLKEDLNTLNGMVNSTRLQLQWLIKSQRITSTMGSSLGRDQTASNIAPDGPTRRLSDSSTKL